MKKITRGFVIIFVILAFFVLPAAAQEEDSQNQRDLAFEQEIYDRLSKVNLEAVPVFQAATAALDRDDLETARQGFEKVLKLAPDFPDALRRLSTVYLYQNDIERAEVLARQALAALDAAENKASLAFILLNVDTPASNGEAFNLAKEAVAEQPDDIYNQAVLVFASAATENVDMVRQSSADVIRLAPENPMGHFYSGLAAAMDEKWEQAESELLLAKKLGWPADEVQTALDNGIATQALLQRGMRWGTYGLAGWIVALGILFLVGLILSQVTLASVKRQKGLTSMEINPAERLVRQVYRVVIAITSAYFYFSIPILLLLVIALIGLILYAFFAIGQIPIRLALMILFAGLYTLYAVVRSLFIRRIDSDPGKVLKKEDAYYLWDLLEDTARRVGTRPVEKVFVTAGTEIGVYERGSWWKRLHGQGERRLILGLGALPGMNQGQLRAIIAHEYGHFNHADTAGGDLAHSVSFNIQNMAQGLARVGTARWYNPVWLFINGYYRIFLRITHGASRLQEILADRYATIHYGVRNMKTGLEHIIRQDLQFNQQAVSEINLAIESQRPLHNLYTLPPAESNADLDAAYEKVMHEKTSPYASHPSPGERLEYIVRLPAGGVALEDPRPVWELLPGAAGLQEEMTRIVENNLRTGGALKFQDDAGKG